MFFEFARAVKELKPKMFLVENVKGLKTHDKGNTLKTIVKVLGDLGYKVLEPTVLNSNNFNVPQKRERIIIIGIRNDLYKKNSDFKFPTPYNEKTTLKDALKKGTLYDCDVPSSIGQKYPDKKVGVLRQVPQGGYWRDLPIEVQKEYMGGSFYLGGGKTGIARRISWNEPCLTLTCSPAQKQTERCHPDETRPFTVREYARIQTFPDNWEFQGGITSQYKQIGNAVPVNLAYALGISLSNYLSSFK